MSHGVGRVQRALDHQYSAAATILAGTIVALSWSGVSAANYRRALSAAWIHGHAISAHSVVLDGAMTIFFAAVGLELSRELRTNLHHHLRSVLSPVLGAVGGMGATALGSFVLGEIVHSSALRRGWSIPMATDVAFTLGVLALAGPRVPRQLRLFLLTLAIADDVLSVAILSATGASHVRLVGFVAIAILILVGVGVARRGNPAVVFFTLIVPMWLAFEWAGIEPALSGVVVGLIVPVVAAPARRLESSMSRWATGVALPLFAIVACGVSWTSLSLSGVTGKIIVGTIVVRLVGKILGISAGIYVASHLGGHRHASLTPRVLLGATCLCAIGFTVPLLFAGNLFGSDSATYSAFTVGLLGASVIGSGVGVVLLRRATR
ncbi:MAG TPA: Na+/H+ antiporter NhaA [Acidimicrobiales bacterium]